MDHIRRNPSSSHEPWMTAEWVNELSAATLGPPLPWEVPEADPPAGTLKVDPGDNPALDILDSTEGWKEDHPGMKSPMVLSLLDAHPETIAEQLASYHDPEGTRPDTAHYVNCVAPLLKNSDTAGPGDRVVFAADNSEERSVDGPRQLIRSKPVSERSSCTPLNPPDHNLVVNAINPAGAGHATPSQQYGAQRGPS